MTLEKLKQIANNLPADTIILIDSTETEVKEVVTIDITYHTDGRAHLILSDAE